MSQDDESSTESHPQNGKHRAADEHQRDVDPLRRHVVDPPHGVPSDRQEENGDDDGDDSEDTAGDPAGESDNPQRSDPKKKKSEGEGEKKNDQKSNPRGKVILAIVGLVLLVLLLAVGLPWYLHARHFETTDDAFVDAHWEKVSPRVAGRVLHVYKEDNERVEQNELLLKIDPGPFAVMVEQQQAAVAEAEGKVAQQRAQLTVADAGVGQAQAEVDRTTVMRDNAATELKRYEGLSAEAVSRQRLDDLRVALRSAETQLASANKGLESSRAQIELAKSQITAAQAGVQSARAQLENVKLQLSYTDVVAATAGRVTQRGVQDGDYVTPGQQLLNLVPIKVWVTANYKETQLTDMKPGQDVDLEVDAFPGQTLNGRVQSIQAGSGQWFSLLPPENATGNYVKVVQRVPVKITIDDTDSDLYKKLGPGMSVVPRVRVR